MKQPARRLFKFGSMVAVLTIWVVILRPHRLGGPASYIVVRGTSMLPTYQNGDLVIMQSAPDYAVGDAVAYWRAVRRDRGRPRDSPSDASAATGWTGFAVQGDNNDAVDPWMPRATDIAGKSWAVVPGVGRLIAIIQPVIAGGLAVRRRMVALIRQRGQSRPKPKAVEPPRRRPVFRSVVLPAR